MTSDTGPLNPYREYPAFEAAFQARYGDTARRWPFAMLAVELELRKERDGIAGFGAARPRPPAERFAVDALATLSLRFGRPDQTSDGYYVKLTGLPELRADISERLTRRGLRSISDDRVLGFRRNRQIHALATRGAAFATFLDRLARSGAAAAIADAALMSRLDADFRRNRDDLARLMQDTGLRLLISDGDAMPWQRVMVSAAQMQGIPYVTIAHGYVQNRHLVSIAPIRGDALVTWTQVEAADLRAVLPTDQADKVTSFGFPRHGATVRPKEMRQQVLVAWDPISLKPEAERPLQIDTLGELAAQVRAAGLEPRIRLHPKDRSLPEVTRAVTALGLTLSTDPLNTAFAAAQAVVGSTSSVIFEGMAAGLPGLQIAEHCRGVSIAGARIVPLGGLAGALRALPDAAPSVRAFDMDGFTALLDRLLG